MEFTISKKDFNDMVSLVNTVHDKCTNKQHPEIDVFKISVRDNKLEATAMNTYAGSKFYCFCGECSDDGIEYIPMLKKITEKCSEITVHVEKDSVKVISGDKVIDTYERKEDYSFPEIAMKLSAQKAVDNQERFQISVNPIMLAQILENFNDKDYLKQQKSVTITFCGNKSAFFITGDHKSAMVMPMIPNYLDFCGGNFLE